MRATELAETAAECQAGRAGMRYDAGGCGEAIDLRGRIPLDPLVCDTGDTGLPLVLSQPETSAAEEFQKVAAAITEILSRSAGPAPISIIN